MARTTITNDRVGVAQGNVVAQAVNFDMSMTGYGDDTPVKASTAKLNPKLINKNGDMPVVSARANNAIIRDVSAKPVVASAIPEQNLGLQSIGGVTPLNQVVLGEQNKPAPIAVVKAPEPATTVSVNRIFGGSTYDKDGKHTTVSGQAARTQVETKLGSGVIKISNTEHDNIVDTKVKGKTTRQNIQTSDYQIEYEQKVRSNTTAFVAGRSSTTRKKDDGKTDYNKTDSVIRVSGGFRQSDSAGNGTEIKKSLWAYRDFGGSSTPVTALNASIGVYKTLTPASSPTKITGFVDASGRLRLPDNSPATVGVGLYVGVKGVIPVFKNASLEIGVRGGIENSLNTLTTRDFNYGGSGGSTNWSPQYDATVKFAYKF